MKHLEELERQLSSGAPLDPARISNFQVLDALRLESEHVMQSIERQKAADDLLLGVKTNEPDTSDSTSD